jgi:hypothetical protein
MLVFDSRSSSPSSLTLRNSGKRSMVDCVSDMYVLVKIRKVGISSFR